jgi:hypothetical protein
MAFPTSPSAGDTHVTGHGSTYTYNDKGAWDLTTIGTGYLPFSGTLTMTPDSLDVEIVGTAVSVTFEADGGTSPYTYALNGGSLPPGLALSSGGALTGTPTTAGNYAFAVIATDAGNHTVTNNYSVTVKTSDIVIAPSVMPAMRVGHVFSQTVTATGGDGGPYTFAVTDGALPAGLSIASSTGAITGTPTAEGTYAFTITATDGSSKTGARSYGGLIASQDILINPHSLPTVPIGSSISVALSASGGTAPYTWSVVSGALPTGLSLNASTGIVSGVPTTAGTYGFTIQALDADGNWGKQAVSSLIEAIIEVVSFWPSFGCPRDRDHFNGDFFFDNNRCHLYHKRGGRWFNLHDSGNSHPDYYPFYDVVGGFAVVYEQIGNPDAVYGGIGIAGDFYHDLTTHRLHFRYKDRWTDYVYQLDATLPPGFATLLAWGDSATPNVNCKYWIDTRFRVVYQWAYGTTWQRFPAGAVGVSFHPLTTIIDYQGNGTAAGINVRLPPVIASDPDVWSDGRGWFVLDRNVANGPRLFQWAGLFATNKWKLVNDWKGQRW